MNYQNLLQSWVYELSSLYDEREVNNIFTLCATELLGWNRIDLQLNKSDDVALHDQIKWRAVLEELKSGKPIQHVFGRSEFYGLALQVNQHTLIPRPETEELVDWIIKDVAGKKVRVLDVGTGSGCIALALAKHLDGEVHAVDVSEKALEIAEENSKDLHLKVRFHQQSVLNEWIEGPWDVVVSNPPYIPYTEKKEVGQNVLNFEPDIALFVDHEDPLLFYKTIFKKASQDTGRQVVMYFELNPNYSSEYMDFVHENGWKTELKNDLQGKERMLKVWYE